LSVLQKRKVFPCLLDHFGYSFPPKRPKMVPQGPNWCQSGVTWTIWVPLLVLVPHRKPFLLNALQNERFFPCLLDHFGYPFPPKWSKMAPTRAQLMPNGATWIISGTLFLQETDQIRARKQVILSILHRRPQYRRFVMKKGPKMGQVGPPRGPRGCQNDAPWTVFFDGPSQQARAPDVLNQ